jgi:hypothetical protein
MTTVRRSLMIGAILCAATAAFAEDAPTSPPPAVPPACQQMLEQMKLTDAHLDEHVKAMNASQGPEKMDAMAAAINDLADQRRAMRAHMDSMPCGGMNGGMPGHGMMMGR